jgi:hypothetical protein
MLPECTDQAADCRLLESTRSASSLPLAFAFYFRVQPRTERKTYEGPLTADIDVLL